MPTPKASGREHICSWCSLSFSKKEHLARHTRSHTREKPFTCSRCGKLFSRKDTLLRHSRTHEPVTNVQQDLGRRDSIMTDTIGVTSGVIHPAHSDLETFAEPPVSVTSLLPNSSPSQNTIQNAPPTISSTHSSSQGAAAQPVHLPMAESNAPSVGVPSFSDESSMNQIYSDEDAWNTGLDSQISSFLTNADLDLNALETSMISFLNDSTLESCVQPNMERTVYSDRLTELACSHKEDAIRRNWFTSFGLNSSGIITPDTEFGQTHVDDRFREELYIRLQPRIPNDPLPSTEFLNLCIRMYFTRFNPIFPIIHVPTFRMPKKSSLLLLSICSLGSLLLGSDRAAMHGRHIFDRVSQAALASWDNHISRGKPEALLLLQSALIGHTFALLSGRPRDLLTVQSFHGTVIAWAKKHGIFQQQARAEDKICEILDHDLELAWKSWAQIEEQKRLAVALYAHDSEYSALLKTEPLMRHSASKLPTMCSKQLWEAPSAHEWRKVLSKDTQNANNTPNLPTNEPFNPLKSLLKNPNRMMQDSFSIDCELEVIAACITEARELDSWPSARSQLEASLLQLYENRLKSTADGVNSLLCLEIFWHFLFISLYADLNLLEICAGRDGYEESQQHLHYAKSLAASPDGQRCALHGALILRKSGRVSVSATTAIYLPRVLFNTALVWYWYTEFGHEEPVQAPGGVDEFPEFKMLGIDCTNLLFGAHGFKLARPKKVESSTLYDLVDLLRRQGSWTISRKLASLMSLIIHGEADLEG